jgi:ribosomal protein S18 acetylase RimI-like enzyme
MNNPYLEQKWTPGAVLRRAKVILWDEGPRSLFFKVLGESVYRRLQFTELRFDEVGPATLGDHELVKLDQSSFAGYLKVRTDLDEHKIDERLRRGDECYAIFVDGEIAQTCWLAARGSARVGYLDCEIRLGARDVYVYEFLVHPVYRRRKLFPAALSRLVVEYRRRGYERIVWAWMPENARAVSVARHWPFRSLGMLGYWKIAGFRKYFTSIPDARQPPRLWADELRQWHRVVR